MNCSTFTAQYSRLSQDHVSHVVAKTPGHHTVGLQSVQSYCTDGRLQCHSQRRWLHETGPFDEGDGESMDVLRERNSITRSRLLQKVADEVCASLPSHLRATALNQEMCEQRLGEGKYSFPSLQVTPTGRVWQKGGKLQHLKLDRLENVGRKATYQIILKVLNQRPLQDWRS